MSKKIYIQPDDRLEDALKRIKKDKSKDIQVVVPAKSKIFNKTDLKKLDQEMIKQKKTYILVSNDNANLKIADSIGIKTVSSNPIKKTSINTTKPEPKPKSAKPKTESVKPKSNKIKIVYKKSKSKKESPKKAKIITPKKSKTSGGKNKSKPSFMNQILFGFLSIMSIVIIVTVCLLILPTANIEITTQIDSIPLDYYVSLNTEQTKIDFINNTIPAQLITLEETLTEEARATGQTNQGTKASGSITVHNKSTSDLPLVGNTRFVNTDGVLYRSTSAANIPAGGSTQVNVASDQIGSIGNMGSGKLTLPAIPGSENLYYGQASSISGGTDTIVYSISEEDINYSTDEIREKLYNQAVNDLVAKLPTDKYYISDNIQNIEINTSIKNDVGDQVDTFNIDAETSISFLVYNQKDLEDLTSNSLSKMLSKERVFVSSGIEELDSDTKEFDMQNGTALINISTTALSAPLYNTDVIKKELSGKSSEEVKEYFLQYPEIQQIETTFWPEWTKKVSRIPSRIYISITW